MTARRRRCPSGGTDAAGSLSLETAMVLPLIAMALYALLQVVVVTSDALLVRQAAGIGVRTAVTSARDDEAVAAVTDAIGPGRQVEVVIRPASRSRGDLVTVEVRLLSRFGPITPTVSAHAVARGEPLLGTS